MCGLFGFFGFGDSAIDPRRVEGALDAQAYRGPDGYGTWFSPTKDVALGHVRLAVIAAENGEQPLCSEDGRCVAVVNGEFYGFEDLRRTLEARGHRFSTGSDSEVLIHLYEDHGEECLEMLRGEFALLLWDERRRRLLAARDRFGIKPLQYAITSEGIYFASQAKGLFAAGVEARWDRDSFLQAMHHQYLRPGCSLFEGVRTLRPGHFLVGSPEALCEKIYWDIDFPKTTSRRRPASGEAIKEAAEGLRQRFTEAVELRLRADVPLAVCLSGGLDSSALAAVAAAVTGRELTCFGVQFEAQDYDESRYAWEVAQFLGAKYIPLALSSQEMLEHLPQAVAKAEGLGINGHLPAKFLLGRRMREAGFKVVLTGEGADEALGGYAHFLRDLDGAGELNHRSAELCRGVMLPEGAGPELNSVAKRLGCVPTFLRAKAAMGSRIFPLLRADLRERSAGVDYLAGLLDEFDLPRMLLGRHPVDQAAVLWSRLALSGYILQTLGDGTEMAHGVEGRTPFLDHHFFEFAQRLPISMKIRGGLEKWIFRQAMEDLLPRTILERRKQPFLAPPVAVSAERFCREFLNDHLRSASVLEELFDPSEVYALLDELPKMDERALQGSEPVVMTVLTSVLLGQSLSLESPR